MISLRRFSQDLSPAEIWTYLSPESASARSRWLVIGDPAGASVVDDAIMTKGEFLAVFADQLPGSPSTEAMFTVPAALSLEWGSADHDRRVVIETDLIRAVRETLSLALSRGLMSQRLALAAKPSQLTVASFIHTHNTHNRENLPSLHVHVILMALGRITVLGGDAGADVRWGVLDTKGLFDRQHELSAAFDAGMDLRRNDREAA